jgi:nucleoside-diphosphate-sugar epimerase
VQLLVLGGTAWLGREVAGQAAQRGHDVTCLARGRSGDVAAGTRLVGADRRQPEAYEEVRRVDWDAVLEVSWQPGMVRGALEALHDRAAHWLYVSSASVYASHRALGADESAEVLSPADGEEVDLEQYGPAKVACEQACQRWHGDALLVARAGLIGGPGDASDRTGYWVARAARATERAMLVPDTPELTTQVVDVRDLAGWLVSCAESGVRGVYDAVGPSLSFADWVSLSRQAGRHVGAVVTAPADWLLAHGVTEWSGDGSLPVWLADEESVGLMARSGKAAVAAGLVHRERSALLDDLLRWERSQGLQRPRKAGITDELEADLLWQLSRGA